MAFKISLGMIVRNEGRTLRACLESVAPFVDEIIIGLGGESTDDTEKIAREFTENVFPIEWTDDFGAARTKVNERATGDYFFWLDGDDLLIGGEKIRSIIQSNPNVDSFHMGYDYGRDEQGNCTCYLIRERIVRLHPELPNRGWVWLGKIHEVMAPAGFIETRLLVDGVVVQHHKPPNKHEGDRNLKILYQQLAESEPNPDPRVLAYLCTENMSRNNLAEAIMHGQRFVKVSGWEEEKYQMQHRIADMYRVLHEFEKALDADMFAIQIEPNWPDAWFGLAETYNAAGNYRAAIEYTKAASDKIVPQTPLIINPLDYSYTPAVVLASAYAHLGDFESSLLNYERAYEIKQEPMILATIKLLKNEIKLQAVTKAFLLIREQLGRNDEWLKVRKLYDIVPKHIEHHPAIMETWKRSMEQTAHVINPQIMEDFYTSNPRWEAMEETTIKDPRWRKYPRVAFAIDTARRIEAKNVVDWGCSDGFIAIPLAKELGLHVTGFDLDPRCVELATKRAAEWGVDARFQVGNVDKIGGWEGPKADLAILFEILEHVVDPAATLARVEQTANRIIMTTPYLSWENGNIPDWDSLEPKGHLRIFDQYDIERILTPRGRIWNLYREPYNIGSWLFTEYIPGERHDKNIMIGANSAEAWNPRTLETSGLGGSETAIIKLAEAFSRRGHRPIVYGNIDEPGYYSGACYREMSHFRSEIESDIYIAWRSPEHADLGIRTKCLVLWMHDTDAGDRLTVDRARKFDYIVVLSEWHKSFMLEKYPFLDPAKLVIIGNGVDVSRFNEKVERNPHRVIYSSSADRGLDVILQGIWPRVIKEVPDAELHVYYGWNTADLFSGRFPQLAEFKARVERLLLDSKNVVQHGRVPQSQLAREFKKSAIWLYPTYFSETYCITAVEAQVAGVIPITNHLAALKETVKAGIVIPGDVMDEEVQKKYAEAVIKVMLTSQKARNDMHRLSRKHAPAQSWDMVATSWLQLMRREN